MLKNSDVIAQMRQLIQLIAKHNHAYYVMDQPSISDNEYDQLFHQLKALEQQYPELLQPDTPTNKVGGQALSKFETVTHAVPMLSLGRKNCLPLPVELRNAYPINRFNTMLS